MKALIAAPLSLLLLAVYVCLQAQAPSIKLNNLTTEDGLSGDVLHCICQDKNGFIWVGTQRGIDRFDGYNFNHYIYDPGNANSIYGSPVYKMLQDKSGIIWVATSKGLNSINPVDEKITRYHIPNIGPPVSMSNLLFANDTLLLINANSGLYSFNTRRTEFAEIQMPVVNYNINMYSSFFIKNKKGKVFISTGKDLIIVDWKNKKASVCAATDIAPGLPYAFTYISQVYFDAADNVWCFNKNNVAVLSPAGQGKIQYPFINKDANALENAITGFMEEPGKKLWIITREGLVVYDYVKKSFYRYNKQPGSQVALSNNRITGIIKDKNGVYWMSTFGNGLYAITQDVKFNNIKFNESSTGESYIIYGCTKLPFNKVLAHALARKDFIINEHNQIEDVEQNKDMLPFDSVVYLATGNSLRSFSEYDKQFLCSLYNAKKYADNNAWYISASAIVNAKPLFIDATNKLWLLDSNRLFNGSRYVFTGIKQHIFFAVATKNHTILMATAAGMFVFNMKTMALEKKYLHDEKDAYSIGSDYIKYILPDSSGNCWIATADAGMDYLDAATNRFYHYTVKDGLPDNGTYMIVPDKQGRLWVSTNNGLSCFDTASKTFTNYNKSDGLINTEFNSLSAWTGNNGYLHFGGMSGIDYFNPEDFKEITRQPQLYLSTFKVYDSVLPIRSQYYLPTNDNSITIQFTTNDFSQASKIFYRWQLQGVDEDWVVKKGSNSVLYNKLPPGSYTFTVQASYNSKLWSKAIIVDFKIATPWFQTWWFFTLLAALAVFIVYMLSRYRLRQQLKVYRLRNSIQRDLHDDLGATLSSIKAYAEIIKTNPGNTMIADLINSNASEMIERLEVIIWAANPLHDNMGHFTDRINRFAAPLLRSKKIEFAIATNNVSNALIMPGEVRQHLYLIIKEAINNAAKYSQATLCTINIAVQQNEFLVRVEDDGIGFTSTTQINGNGLNNMRARTAQLDGIINISSMPGKGTGITVTLPYPLKLIYNFQQANNNHPL